MSHPLPAGAPTGLPEPSPASSPPPLAPRRRLRLQVLRRRSQRQPAAAITQTRTFVLNQDLFSVTGDAWIEDGQGNRQYAVDGSLLSLRGTHVLQDLDGTPLYEISKPLTPHLHKTMSISRGGQSVATVQEALVNMTGDRFKVKLAE